MKYPDHTQYHVSGSDTYDNRASGNNSVGPTAKEIKEALRASETSDYNFYVRDTPSAMHEKLTPLGFGFIDKPKTYGYDVSDTVNLKTNEHTYGLKPYYGGLFAGDSDEYIGTDHDKVMFTHEVDGVPKQVELKGITKSELTDAVKALENASTDKQEHDAEAKLAAIFKQGVKEASGNQR